MAVLESMGSDLWFVNGPTVSFLGFPYPTRMVLVRLPDDELWIWSPIELTDNLRRTVQDFGRVRHLVSPNKLHHLYLDEWTEAYPEASLWGPPGLARKRDDLEFTGTLDGDTTPPWNDAIESVLVRGSFLMHEAVFYHRASKSVIVGDLIQKHKPDGLSGWRRWIMQVDGAVGKAGSTPREWRWSFWNRGLAREARDRILQWEIDNLVIAHGQCVRGEGDHAVREALSWLGKVKSGGSS